MKAAYGTDIAKRVDSILLPTGGKAREMWRDDERLYPIVNPYLQDAFNIALSLPAVWEGEHRYWQSFYSVFTNGFMEQYYGAEASHECWFGSFSFTIALPIIRDDGSAGYWTMARTDLLPGTSLSPDGVLHISAEAVELMAIKGYHFSKQDLLARPVRFHIWGMKSLSILTASYLAGTFVAYNSLNVLPEPLSSCLLAVSMGVKGDSCAVSVVASVSPDAGVFNAVLLNLGTSYSEQSGFTAFYDNLFPGMTVGGALTVTVKSPVPYNAAGLSLQVQAPRQGGSYVSVSIAPDYSRSYNAYLIY